MKQSVLPPSGTVDCRATGKCYCQGQLDKGLSPIGPNTSDDLLAPGTFPTNSADIAWFHSWRTRGCQERGKCAAGRHAKLWSRFDKWHSRLDLLRASSGHH